MSFYLFPLWKPAVFKKCCAPPPEMKVSECIGTVPVVSISPQSCNVCAIHSVAYVLGLSSIITRSCEHIFKGAVGST